VDRAGKEVLIVRAVAYSDMNDALNRRAGP
jgi:hypothetical protein